MGAGLSSLSTAAFGTYSRLLEANNSGTQEYSRERLLYRSRRGLGN